MKIDSEFKNLIPELAVGEYQKLEASIIKEGCRDALVVWNDTLLDGHNRYEICNEHSIPFKTTAIELDGRATAKEWILRNQLGRRNLTPYMLGVLALKLEESIAARAKARQKGGQGGVLLKPKSAEATITTREEIAKLAGVGKTQIEQIKVIEKEATSEQKAALSAGSKKVHTVYRELRPQKPKVEVVDGSKICTICGIKKPLTQFYRGKNDCKDCRNYVRQTDDPKGARKNIREMNKHIVNGVDTILENMKNIAPSEEGADEVIHDTIISQLMELVNRFNIEINEFLYMDSALKGQIKPKAILVKAVENLQIIIKKMEEK